MLLQGDNLEHLKSMADNSLDSCVTDPPYGLKFMGKKWDHDVPSVEFWHEVYRVLKPGAHVLSFGGTRTYHRMACAIEDAGFEIRDQIQWLYGSGFPKSHNIGKKLQEWDGFGTALKPANEPIVLARKPLSEKTIVDNVLKWGTGALNVDGCRVGAEAGRWPANVILDEDAAAVLDEQSGFSRSTDRIRINAASKNSAMSGDNLGHISKGHSDSGGASRFFYVAKASKRERNAGLDCSEFVIESESWQRLDLSSDLKDISQLQKDIFADTLMASSAWSIDGFGSSITDLSQTDLTCIISITSKLITELKTSNFCQNSNTKDFIAAALNQARASGLNLAESVKRLSQSIQNTTSEKTASALGVSLAVLKMLLKVKGAARQGNFHNTVKPIKLMAYLCRLITPPGGTILDPFMGSGSTGCAAKAEGFKFVGIELNQEYFEIAEQRIATHEEGHN